MCLPSCAVFLCVRFWHRYIQAKYVMVLAGAVAQTSKIPCNVGHWWAASHFWPGPRFWVFAFVRWHFSGIWATLLKKLKLLLKNTVYTQKCLVLFWLLEVFLTLILEPSISFFRHILYCCLLPWGIFFLLESSGIWVQSLAHTVAFNGFSKTLLCPCWSGEPLKN